MKIKTIFFSVAALLFTVFQTHAEVIAGPITNPANGHDYYLLSPNTWTASEAEAENLGGTLAIIKSAAEQEWVFSKFGAFGGTNRNLWIGLHRNFPGGPLVWVTGEKIDYSNWDPGQPDNQGGNESYVHLFGNVGNKVPGVWNDLADITSYDGALNCGVVEVPGKSNEKSLTEKEKSLIGTWYASGNSAHPCWIVGTENMLFEIYDRRASRLIYTSEGSLFAIDPQHGIRGEIIKDKILWSNGTWWSRKPVEYKTDETHSDKDTPEVR